MSIFRYSALWIVYLTHELVQSAYNGPPRHIVYILMDDIGWSDISAQNGQFATPFIDDLYFNGIVLDHHYIHHLCSPSRAQFLTGRRCMNMGYGKNGPWGYTQIGAIPIGQPSTANWFRDFVAANPDQDIPRYETYGVGKWHVGYASSYNTPYYKGFDHYYGFYQSGIDYYDKTHAKATFWGTYNLSQWDFFEDENPSFTAVNDSTNTMDLYLTKTEQYLQDFNAQQAANPNETMNMYLYIGGQTLHGPLKRVPRYTDRCKAILDATGVTYGNARLRTCEYSFMTDDWMRDLVQLLIDYGVWDDTLLVWTGDNGADIDVGACNYPLRGTKSTYFEGNIRQLTFVNGGDNVISASQRGTVREGLLSNLDWTPTLLSYAGILDYIDPADYAWDGDDVLDYILNDDDTNLRDSLLININSPNINTINDVDSAIIIFKYEWTTPRGVTKGDGHLYKYVLADVADSDFNWIRQRTDGWCNVDFSNNRSISVTEVPDSIYSASAGLSNKQFLFNLTEDEGETHNLIMNRRISGDRITAKYERKLIRFAKGLIEDEINKQNNADLYHEPIDCFWTMWMEGDPINFEYTTPVHGLYIMPFLGEVAYKTRIRNCFNNIDADNTTANIPAALRSMYLNEWTVPGSVVLGADDMVEMEEYEVVNYRVNGKDTVHQSGLLNNGFVQIFGVVMFVLIALFCSSLYQKRDSWLRGEYKPLIEEDAQYSTFSNSL